MGSERFTPHHPATLPAARSLSGRRMKKQSTEAFDRLAPETRRQLLAANSEYSDREWVASKLQPVPAMYHHRIIRGYAETHKANGRREANLTMLPLAEMFNDGRLCFSSLDDEIREEARKAATRAWELSQRYKTPEAITPALLRMAEERGIEPPKFKDFAQLFNRMTSVQWWRRKLRRSFQKFEAAAIKCGFVHRRAGAYLSDESYRRYQQHQHQTVTLLESLEAVSEDGEVIGMGELAEHSLSNPANRRAQVMTIISGTEQYAMQNGYMGLFLTITCPSRMHARKSPSGELNPKYDGTSPRRAMGYMQGKVWQPARTALDRLDVKYFGVRVTEPHHDGTPHSHMLVFVKPEQADTLIDTLKSYAMRESPDEPGAAEHRFKVEIIDPAKGSAAAYVAKYIAKNLDGHQVGNDFEIDQPAKSTAPRAVAWENSGISGNFSFSGFHPSPTGTNCGALEHCQRAMRNHLAQCGEQQTAPTGQAIWPCKWTRKNACPHC